MPFDLSNTLVVGISATALFDLSAKDALFQEQFAQDRENAMLVYRKTMQEKENDPLAPGTGYHLVEALLHLNRFQDPDKLHIFFDDQDVHLEAASKRVIDL